jgi:hypothetical protein
MPPRGLGTALLSEALRDGVTYTSLTPSLMSRQVFKLMGFPALSESLLLMPPLLHADTLRNRIPMIICDPVSVRPLLHETQRRVFDDHAPYCLQLLVREGDDQAFIVVRRRMMLLPKIGQLLRKAIWMPCSDILHCSNPCLLARHSSESSSQSCAARELSRSPPTRGCFLSARAVRGGPMLRSIVRRCSPPARWTGSIRSSSFCRCSLRHIS